MNPSAFPPDALPDGWLSPLESAFVAFGLGGVLLLVAIVWIGAAAVRALAAAREARRAMCDGRALRPGPGTIHGVVASDDADDAVASVAITQFGSETRGKGGVSHLFREQSRETEARAFWLVLDGGARVRIEPDEHVVLHVPLDRVESVTKSRRRRIARLVSGMRVYVAGVLEPVADGRSAGNDYRSPGVGYVSKASSAVPLVVSTDAPDARLRRRGRFESIAVLVFVALAAFLHLETFARFERLLVAGHVENVTLTWPTASTVRGTSASRFYVNGLLHDASGGFERMRGEVNGSTYDAAMRACRADGLALRAQMPFLVARGAPRVHLPGTRNGLPPSAWWFSLAAIVVALVAYGFARRSTLAWFELSRVDDGGSGPL